jgi:glycine amidinotransferase
MDVNILSLDENTVMVNKYAYGVRDILEKNHFTVIPVELDNSEVFGGGLHCSTLDLYREDEFISYI